MNYLDACLGQFGSLGELFSGINVGVLGPLKGALKLFQLVRSECGTRSSLFPFQRDSWLGV